MSKTQHKTAGERLAAARREKGMTQRDLANRLDVWVDRVHRWEHGMSKPHRSSAAIIADVLGIPVSAWDEQPSERRRSAA